MADLVKRLRSGLDNADRGADGIRELGGVVLTMREAADRIEALEAALRPFADAADEADDWEYEDETQAPVYCGQCRAARATLTDSEGK
jgi:hypothetical protein